SGEGCRAENVIGDHVAEEGEPKERKLGQYAAFIGDRRGHHHVESREGISGNDEEAGIEVGNVANLAGGARREGGEMRFANHSRCRSGCHNKYSPEKVFSILTQGAPKSM